MAIFLPFEASTEGGACNNFFFINKNLHACGILGRICWKTQRKKWNKLRHDRNRIQNVAMVHIGSVLLVANTGTWTALSIVVTADVSAWAFFDVSPDAIQSVSRLPTVLFEYAASISRTHLTFGHLNRLLSSSEIFLIFLFELNTQWNDGVATGSEAGDIIDDCTAQN